MSPLGSGLIGRNSRANCPSVPRNDRVNVSPEPIAGEENYLKGRLTVAATVAAWGASDASPLPTAVQPGG